MSVIHSVFKMTQSPGFVCRFNIVRAVLVSPSCIRHKEPDDKQFPSFATWCCLSGSAMLADKCPYPVTESLLEVNNPSYSVVPSRIHLPGHKHREGDASLLHDHSSPLPLPLPLLLTPICLNIHIVDLSLWAFQFMYSKGEENKVSFLRFCYPKLSPCLSETFID